MLSLNVVAAVLCWCSGFPVTYEVVEDNGTPRGESFARWPFVRAKSFD